MDKELQDWVDKAPERREKYKAQAIEALKEEYPALEIKDEYFRKIDVAETIYQENNKEQYLISYRGVWKRPTDLGLQIEMATDARYHSGDHEIVETDWYTYLITPIHSGTVFCTEFWTRDGRRIKGKRRTRTVNHSTKGAYIELHGKRHYVSFLNKEVQG